MTTEASGPCRRPRSSAVAISWSAIGRRGSVLALTPAGQQHLAAAAQAVRDRLAERLTGWDDGDIAALAQLVTRFNQSRE
jgi:DNA-binding MarR family transcriptional regulator